jgi:hypothetical protein
MGPLLLSSCATELYKQNIGRCEFNNFPNLTTASLNNDDLLVYCQMPILKYTTDGKLKHF